MLLMSVLKPWLSSYIIDLFLVYKIYLYDFLFYVFECFTCLYALHHHMCAKVRRVIGFPESRVMNRAVICTLGSEPRWSSRAPNALDPKPSTINIIF